MSTSETLVEVNIKLVFTMTSCELASWESPNCGCTAVVIHNYGVDLSTAIIFCSKCKGIRVRKIENFPDSKIFVAKTFRINVQIASIFKFATNAHKR